MDCVDGKYEKYFEEEWATRVVSNRTVVLGYDDSGGVRRGRSVVASGCLWNAAPARKSAGFILVQDVLESDTTKPRALYKRCNKQ